VADGLDSDKTDALEPIAVNPTNANAATIAQLSLRIEIVTPPV